MKKAFSVFLALVCSLSFAFVSCEKSTTETPVSPALAPPARTNNTVACTDSAFLAADSLYAPCNNSVLMPIGRNIRLVPNHPIPAIDTIVNGAHFYLTWDSVGTFNCGGISFIRANISCYQRY